MDGNNGFAIFILIIFGIIVVSFIWYAIYSIKIKIFFDGLERALRNARTVTDCKYIIVRDNNIDKNNFEIFNAILQGSFRHALDKNKHSMLLTCDDKPCGIMVNLNKTACHFVNYICTWPIEPDKKAPFGAQTLFEEMFKNFLNSQAKFIELYAIRFGDAISKYMRIGFTPRGGDNDVELMKISRAKVLESYKKLKERINLEPANNKEDIDLLKELKY